MEQYKLKRTGLSPLHFHGELIAEASDESSDRGRWHSIQIYSLPSGRYICWIGYATRWVQAEQDLDLAEVFNTPGEVESFLRSYNPCAPVIGFPSGEHYREKQAVLMATIKRRYETLVSEVLEKAGISEEIA